MRLPRYTTRGLFFATTFVALCVGLFTAAARAGGLPSRIVPAAVFIAGFAIWAAAWGVIGRRLHPRPTPRGVRLCWGLMIAGGMVALAIPIALMFVVGPWLFPTIYLSLLVGTTAIAHGAAGETRGLARTATLQVANIVALDPANVLFAAMEFALLRSARVRDYLESPDFRQL
jgi:hypothetical protein